MFPLSPVTEPVSLPLLLALLLGGGLVFFGERRPDILGLVAAGDVEDMALFPCLTRTS